MSFLKLYPEPQNSPDEEQGPIFQTRAEIIREMNRRRKFDIVVIGGGIHGAIFARLAALNGLKTVLLEAGDYGSGASALCSALSGGVPLDYSPRSLLSLRRRAGLMLDLVETSGGLASFGNYLLALDLPWLAGPYLKLHEFFLNQRAKDPEAKEHLGTLCPGVYCNERRIIVENILAARQEGALCLNYAAIQSVASGEKSAVAGVGWRDSTDGTSYEIQASAVVNCAGVDAPLISNLRPALDIGALRYYRQTDLVFAADWPGCAIVLPCENQSWLALRPDARTVTVSFVAEETENKSSVDGHAQALAELQRHFPDIFLLEKLIFETSARRGSLPERGAAFISGGFRWSWHRGMFTLFGGDFVGAAGTAWEGFKKIVAFTTGGFAPVPVFGRRLPCAGGGQEVKEKFMQSADRFGVAPLLAAAVFERLGSRVRLIPETPESFEVLGGDCLRGEVTLALKVDQAEMLADVLERRIGLSLLPGNGSVALDGIVAEFVRLGRGRDLDSQISTYLKSTEAV